MEEETSSQLIPISYKPFLTKNSFSEVYVNGGISGFESPTFALFLLNSVFEHCGSTFRENLDGIWQILNKYTSTFFLRLCQLIE